MTDPGLPKQTEAEQILISGAKKVPQFTMAKKLMQLPDCSALQYSMWQFMLKGSALYPPLASNPGLQRLARCLFLMALILMALMGWAILMGLCLPTLRPNKATRS
ncbi:hypothetical protein Cabther_A0592 [Chloracidobacterium thermophilum B]|uniref:Uncharacterized protein n=1 Tax=Chloracidobacterium thermophilum (strain B) TaxID=981222 RepID=G2LED0_CHLTF|nr:hypothetical protein Cabther_A0592 [Chloracidobacterium thermophilum B]